MNDRPITLIAGKDSTVGRALMAHLRRTGEVVLGTTRRHEPVNEFTLYLDLSKDVENWKCPWPVNVAYICAGITNLEACKHDSEGTANINVKGTFTLVKNLVRSGAFVIYLSSNQVFDGSICYRLPDDPVSPITEYGRQKAMAESQINQYGESVAIVRFTKIISPRHPLFSNWAESMKKGKIIQPFSDMFMAPVPLIFAVSVLRLVGDLRLAGILQVSGERDVSYDEAARIGTRLLGLDSDLVQPIEACRSGVFTESVPAHTTLNINRLKSTLGIMPPDVQWTIEKAFENLEGR